MSRGGIFEVQEVMFELQEAILELQEVILEVREAMLELREAILEAIFAAGPLRHEKARKIHNPHHIWKVCFFDCFEVVLFVLPAALAQARILKNMFSRGGCCMCRMSGVFARNQKHNAF